MPCINVQLYLLKTLFNKASIQLLLKKINMTLSDMCGFIIAAIGTSKFIAFRAIRLETKAYQWDILGYHKCLEWHDLSPKGVVLLQCPDLLMYTVNVCLC